MNRLASKGFTLVEMMVIAPIVILLIGAFIAAIVGLTGEVMSSRGSNVVAYDVQDALNRIEEDVKLSTGYLATNSIKFTATPAPANPQGYGANGSYTDFTNAGGANGTALILNTLVTNGNPLSITTSSIYLANKPNDCGDPTLYTKNTPMTANVIYYTYNGSLWRRIVMPKNYTVAAERCGSAAPWQQPSCQPGYSSTYCKTNDIKLIEGVAASDFIVQYFSSASGTAASTPAVTGADLNARNTALQSTPTVSVSIIARKSIAGRDIERSGTLRATRLDTNASAIAKDTTPTAVPGVPNVSNTVSGGHNVTFTWPRVATATSYSLDWRKNGGSWVSGGTAIDNNSRSYTVTDGTHEDVIEARVRANNVVGNSAYGSSSADIPLWAPLIVQAGWTDYGSTYSTAAYTKTASGIVMLRGLLKNSGTPGSYSVIASLPDDYKPSGRLIFGASTAPNASARIDIEPRAGGADVLYGTGGNPGWLSLDTIRYIPANTALTKNTPTFQNGYSNYAGGGAYEPVTYVQDSTSRVTVQGLVSPGTLTNGTIIFTLPAAMRPAKYQHHASRAEAFAHLGIDPASGMLAKGDGTGFLSLNSSFLPASYTSWTNLTLVNGWVWYDGSSGMFSTPQYTKTSDNVVQLKGLIRSGSTTYDTNIATLPAGFRPKGRLIYTTGNSGGYARLDILPTGEIRFEGSTNGWQALDNVMFIAEL
jgi:Tfp pilus assembly protein PilE